MRSNSSLWVVVLAGGDGRRLAPATRDASGDHVPKQFCRFGAAETLLNHALGRARRLAPPERLISVVQEAHRRWWRVELADLPERNVISQPGNRGTAVALLQAVATIHSRDRDATVLVLPSDHEVEDERAWHATLRRVADAATLGREHVFLVGVEPQADAGFGWIVPGDRSEHGTRTVLRFSEKPGIEEAAWLARQGALCSTFVFASSMRTFLDVFRSHPCERIARYAQSVSDALPGFGISAATTLDFPYSDFSHDLLERAPHRTRLVAGDPCGWTDLGTPNRLARWLGRRGSASSAVRSPLPSLAGAGGGS